MKLFIRAALSGSLLFTLLCAGAILIGRGNPTQPELFKYLSTCDGQPCYLGVVPGKTSWHDAVAIFENMQGTEAHPNADIASNPLGFRGRAAIYASQSDKVIVDNIALEIASSYTSIGSLVEEYGSPCVISGIETRLGVIFPNMVVIISTDQLEADQFLKPSIPVSEIDLLKQFESCDEVPDFSGRITWHGFGRYTN